MSDVHNIVAKVWKLCDILRDDGITYHQYVNELTYLLFLKMAAETGTEKSLLNGCRWSNLIALSDEPDEQFGRYLHMLDDLGTRGRGRVKQIFTNPTTFLHSPENLNSLVKEIDSLDWHTVDREGLGDIYEGILQKNASELKGGAGQYFTPRPLIDTIVQVIRPQPGELIVDPAAGTGGFFISANASLLPKKGRFFGVELVRDTHRLALMNAALHDVPGDIVLGDSLVQDGVDLPTADIILTNPPFGSKKGSSRTMRSDLPFPSSNKQIAFLQLIYLTLKRGGRAAVVLPDNVLFEEGVGAKVRRDLMEKCNLHTILRLPTGIFYAHGVKTNVLFFTRGKNDSGNTKEVWVYDLRTSMPSFGKRDVLSKDHFAEFQQCYGRSSAGSSKRTDHGEQGRFRCFTRKQITQRGDNLDINWLDTTKDNGHVDMREPEEIAVMIREQLETAIEEIDALTVLLESEEDDV